MGKYAADESNLKPEAESYHSSSSQRIILVGVCRNNLWKYEDGGEMFSSNV
jgi:hypothetical protein